MSCERHREIDLAGYAADPRSPEFATFREHFPTCATCAPIVADWIALRGDLMALEAGGAHPALDVLAASAGGDAAAHRAIEGHLSACAACRTELRVSKTFEAPAVAAPAVDGRSWFDRLSDSLASLLPAPALATVALTLLALPVGWFVWRLIPAEPGAGIVAATDSTAASTRVEEFAAAAPGEPEIRVAGNTDSADEIPDDDPSFDAAHPFEVGFNDTGFPGFSEQELGGMPEPSLELEPVALADPLESGVAVAEPGQVEPEALVAADPEPTPSVADPDMAPIQIAALLPSELPRYVPSAALSGSLASLRMDSAVRGAQASLPRIQAMAPDHVAAVESAAPTLYWWLSAASDVPVEVTLVARESGDTLLEQRFAPPVRRGLHTLALPKEGVHLPQGEIVEWYVALVVDEDRRELDEVANAALRFVPPPSPFEVETGQQAHARAAAGYWIDAFAQLTRWIEAEPGVEVLRSHRGALLSQVGLELP